ncbi:Kynurenine formamidase [Caulifigura coniformis]|uniref:Kynurenine formamidase n=1 Tax=Caulifigura coniformis TaxID=2527983 RepID=A0A517SMX7_9PLAN|nr:cyclase family protein [Caulifigura coniformis]QDT57479.1 Kynurenine formamidase [Caulifigura coniformis]
MTRRRGICIGAGYFSQFHLDAWRRMEDVEIVALCDVDEARAREAAKRFEIRHAVKDLSQALKLGPVDFVDIITPPASHRALVEQAAEAQLNIICQKPLAPDYRTARRIVEEAARRGVRFMVHENFRFQPWHREIRRLIDVGAVGDRLHSLTMRTRLGDGWGPDAYLARQPYFRDMPRLLVHETGVHLIDLFRFLGGEIVETYSVLRRLNDVIAGEDTGLLTFRMKGGAVAVWDANRFNDSTAADPRYTFGEMLVEGNGGSIRLASDGGLTVQPLGGRETTHAYTHVDRGFGGDCVYFTQRHFIDCLNSGAEFETNGAEYLKTLAVVEAVYQSARENRPVAPGGARSGSRRFVDLSLRIDESLPNASVTDFRTLERDGWNATTLTLYSHCGTHMDAPRHFLAEGATIDEQALEVCCGPARVIDLTPTAPKQLLTVDDFGVVADLIGPGDRLLLRTDWHKRFGTDDYRNGLPRISAELAQWLVDRGVALVGVEPPSVADVNDMRELTEVHRILLGGNVCIVEGLAHLDQLQSDVVEFMAFPLRISRGDGCPVRAVAYEFVSEFNRSAFPSS